MIIYKTTNLINGKIYIGKDSDNCKNYLGGGSILNLAIKKHGKENFKKETLRVCKSQKELDIFEKIFIRRFNSIDKNIGYNILSGGGESPTKNKEVANRMRQTKIKKFSTSEGDETRRLIGLKHKNKIVSSETRIKIGLKSKNRKPSKESNDKNRQSQIKRYENYELRLNLSMKTSGQNNPNSKTNRLKREEARLNKV